MQYKKYFIVNNLSSFKLIILAFICTVIFSLIRWMYINKMHSLKKHPNIILISIEAARPDHLGCYGYNRMTSPTIDNLAEDGVLFSNVFTQRALTWPSLTSIMSSLYPVKHGVRDNGHLISSSTLTLAEILKDNDYTCSAFLANGNKAGWKGFDYKISYRMQDSKITQEAVKWLKNNYKEQFFMWIHYWEPHWPYQPPSPYENYFDPGYTGPMNGDSQQTDEITLKKIQLNETDLNHIISLYDGSILSVDAHIKDIINTLDSLGIYEDSLIIITADHGQDLYQHNYYFYHGGSVYGSSLQIPLIIRLPNKAKRSKKITRLAEAIDIAPTILELSNIPIPEQFEGSSLVPLIWSKKQHKTFPLAVSEWENNILSVRSDKYRYIFNPGEFHPKCVHGGKDGDYIVEKEELYDITKDPLESNNIILSKRKIADKMLDKLHEWPYFNLWTQKDIEEKEIPKDIKKHLRALGYAH